MLSDARLNDIISRYPQQPHYLLAALQDVQAMLGSVPEAIFSLLTKRFNADAATAASLQPLFASQPAEESPMAICTGPVCRRHGLLQAMRASGIDNVSECDCLGLCDQAPAAIVHGEKIPHASVALLQRLGTGS